MKERSSSRRISHVAACLLAVAAVVFSIGPTRGSALKISPIPDQITNEDTATSTIPVSVGAESGDVSALTLSAFVDESPLLDSGSVVFGGSGADRTVTVTPKLNQIGRASIRVTVSDGKSSSSVKFILTVVRVIGLPPMPGLELPAGMRSGIPADASPMKELLASATAGGLRVTHDRAGYVFPVGGTRVTWTAWEGEPRTSPPKAVKSGNVYVFPNGLMPVGLSMDDRATSGNHAAKVVRDGAGRIHLAWLDTGRPGIGDKVMYRRGVQDPASGAVRWETDPLVVADAAWDSHLAVAASAHAVHFAWFQDGTNRYRRLVDRDGSWVFDPPRDTRAEGRAWDNGPDIGVRGDDEIHVITATGVYAVSTNGGAWWKRENVPLPAGASIKGPALSLDSTGNSHVIYTAMYRGTRYPEWRYNDPNGAYWELRYVRRQADGKWVDEQNVLAAFPDWRDFNADKSGDDDRDSSDGDNDAWDSLADWADVAVDDAGTIHVAWHGPVNGHIFGNDEAFYARRPASGAGDWGAWESPVPLYPKDPAKGHTFSYAPSLCTDASSSFVLAVVFFETTPGHPGVPGDTGSQLFDSILRVIRSGKPAERPIELTSMARHGMSTWFPCAGPRLFRHPSGRAWLDVLQTTTTPADAGDPFHFVIYQRREVTGLP
jgi:hypothetical protein